ncbi:hypothetical protein FRB94_007110 [Tulasnella sp. JGI-2019a]|nr:hypothetical protein FRB94_007110 [Tulasnella sp. JGI-2019a]KAG9040081.1 hypothetical protein FRB95_000010 [Tulasnella sp. JGI-2019a]
MCCTGAAWKREEVQDHKFDFVDTRDFRTKSFGVRVQYMWIYVLVLKSFLVYISDIYTACTMLTSTTWTNTLYNRCPPSECPTISFSVGKWIFVGCIIFSFLLLAYEAQKSKKIIASRDISYAFTNIMANSYYSLRSYDHFCFFSQIENSTKKKDDFAFFIFFTFKEWKRVLLADGPRQCINGLTLYSFWVASGRGNPFDKIDQYYNGDYVTAILLVTMIFTVLIFIGSLLLLVVAGVLYVPLLCYIRGNLKEYCCHKVDKRIAELLKKKAQQRVQRQAALARKEAEGDFNHLKGKKGATPVSLPQQPTLPSVAVDDFLDMKDSRYSRQPSQQDTYWEPDHKSDYNGSLRHDEGGADYGYASHDYPPMPGYHGAPPYGVGDPNARESLYGYENDLGYRNGPTDEMYSSSAHLTHAAAPPAGYYQDQHGQYYAEDDGYNNQHYGPPPPHGGGAGYAM